MMKVSRKQLLAVCLLSFSMAAANLNAQDLAAAQKALTDAQAKVTTLASEQKSASQEIARLKAERAGIVTSLAPATAEFEAVKTERDKALADAKANPSDSSKQVADNANFKFMLAERKYNKAKESLDAHDARIAELEQRLKNNDADLKATQAAIERQKVSITQLQQKSADAAKAAAAAAALKKEQELQAQKNALAETQAKAAAAQAEVERLKKELAAKAAAEAAAKAAAPAAAAAAVATAAPAAATAKPAATADTSAAKAGFEQRIAATNQRNMRKLPSRIVTVKSAAGNKQLSLSPVAENLYQGDTSLDAGDLEIVAGLVTSKQSVSGADGGKKFQIMLDTAGGKTNIVIYPAP